MSWKTWGGRLACPLLALLVAGCAMTARSSLDASWIDPTVKGKKFKKVLILSVAHDEFAQQYFRSEKDKYAKLVKKAGIELQ